MAESDLESLAPQVALDWYLEHRRDELRTATRRKHASALGIFVEWLEEAGIDDLNDLGGRQLVAFKTWRKTETGLNTVSLNGTLAILRTFLQFCEDVEAVEEGLAEKVPLPNVPPEEEVCDVAPDDETVQAIRSHYRQFEYASRRHVQFELIAEVGLRLGAVRALDLGDFDHDDRVLHVRHRSEGRDDEGTPLKNGADGERIVNVPDWLADLVGDYIARTRRDVTDEYGRQPLFTTDQGRVSKATIRRDFYKLTRPCEYSGECPHGREIADCEATKNSNAGDCPGRFSSHPLRRWSIMHQLDAGVPKELLSDRVDVSVPVLEKHYDQRTAEQKSRRRREELTKHFDSY